MDLDGHWSRVAWLVLDGDGLWAFCIFFLVDFIVLLGLLGQVGYNVLSSFGSRAASQLELARYR
jgi:hypothetical protein